MAWIESHQELRHHYKTKRLARELKVSTAAAVGHLHFLWWWAVDFAPDGDLTKFDDYEIADAMGYDGKDPAKAKSALISAGFLDNNEQGTITIHDWNEYAGRTLSQREKARTRSKNYREKQAAHAMDSVPPPTRKKLQAENVTEPHQTDNVQVPYANGTHTVQETGAGGMDSETVASASTEHNSTEHNSTEHNSTGYDNTPISPKSGGAGEGVQGASATDARFEEFWKAYPKKQGKGAALKAWNKIKPDKRLFETILASVRDNVENNQQWRRDNGQYIPNPSTWLNQQRWLDEIPAQQGGVGYSAGSHQGFQRSTGFRSADDDSVYDGG